MPGTLPYDWANKWIRDPSRSEMPRTIIDLAGGVELTTGLGRKTWAVQVQVTNATNKTALYNFQSVFVGTRLVQPRTFSVRVTRHF